MDRKNVGRKNSGRNNVGRKNSGRKNAVTVSDLYSDLQKVKISYGPGHFPIPMTLWFTKSPKLDF